MRIQASDGAIRPEMNAKVTFLEPPAGPKGAPEVLAPREAIVTRDGQPLVYVVEGTKAVGRPVRIGEEVDGRVEVREGLQGGEAVVVRGAKLLRDGQRIKVKR